MNTISLKIDNQAFGLNKTSIATTSASSSQGKYELTSFSATLKPHSDIDFKQTPVSSKILMGVANNTLPMKLNNTLPQGSLEYSPIDQGFDVANFSKSISKTLDNLDMTDKMVGGSAGTQVWGLLKDVPQGLENIAATELSNTQGKLGQSLYGETVDLLLTNPKHLDHYVKKYGAMHSSIKPDITQSIFNTGGEYLVNKTINGVDALIDDPMKVIKDIGNGAVDLAKLGNDYIKNDTLIGVAMSLQQGNIAGIVESYYRVEPVKEAVANELKNFARNYSNLGMLPHLASRIITGASVGVVAAPAGVGITAATVNSIGKGASRINKALQTATSPSVLSAAAESVQRALPVIKKKIPLPIYPVVLHAVPDKPQPILSKSAIMADPEKPYGDFSPDHNNWTSIGYKKLGKLLNTGKEKEVSIYLPDADDTVFATFLAKPSDVQMVGDQAKSLINEYKSLQDASELYEIDVNLPLGFAKYDKTTPSMFLPRLNGAHTKKDMKFNLSGTPMFNIKFEGQFGEISLDKLRLMEDSFERFEVITGGDFQLMFDIKTGVAIPKLVDPHKISPYRMEELPERGKGMHTEDLNWISHTETAIKEAIKGNYFVSPEKP